MGLYNRCRRTLTPTLFGPGLFRQPAQMAHHEPPSTLKQVRHYCASVLLNVSEKTRKFSYFAINFSPLLVS